MTPSKPTRRTVRRRMWGGFINGRLVFNVPNDQDAPTDYGSAALYGTATEARRHYDDTRPVLVTWSGPKPKTQQRRRKT